MIKIINVKKENTFMKQPKKLLSMFLAVMVVIGILPSIVFAADMSEVQVSDGTSQVTDNAKAINADNSQSITVHFTLRRYTADGTPETSANYSNWIQNTSYTMSDGATAYDLFQQMMGDHNLTYQASGSYVYAVTNSDGQTLSASGNSVWMYGVNNQIPSVSMDAMKLQDGDSMIFFYVDDYNIIYGSSDTDVLNVKQLIGAIGNVTLDSGAAIESARNAYDLLTDLQKMIVNAEMDTSMTVTALEAAENIYAQLLAGDLTNNKAATAVQQMIDAIGTVTLGSRNVIQRAREAYNDLTAEQKILVTNIADLIAAEQALEALFAAKSKQIDQIFEATGNYLLSGAIPVVASVGGDWTVLGLARAGRISEKFRSGYYKNVLQAIAHADSVQLHRSRSTENSRVAIALTSLGYNAAEIDGQNLLLPLADLDYVNNQGVNGPIWALIAFDTANYNIPTVANGGNQTTREALIETILTAQKVQGGWSLGSNDIDIDTTAMAIQALAPYYPTNATVQAAVDKALFALSGLQSSDGGFTSFGESSSESSAQVITALTSLGINPDTDARFIKNGNSVLDALLSFYVNGGGFRHTTTGEISRISTEQGYCALASYYRLLGNQNSLYNMRDIQFLQDTQASEFVNQTETTNRLASPQTANDTNNYNIIITLFILSLAAAAIALGKRNTTK